MKVGSAWVVGWESSKHPPWSTEMSTSTLPGFILATSALLTSFGVCAPAISTEPITRSAPTSECSISKALLAMVLIRPA